MSEHGQTGHDCCHAPAAPVPAAPKGDCCQRVLSGGACRARVLPWRSRFSRRSARLGTQQRRRILLSDVPGRGERRAGHLSSAAWRSSGDATLAAGGIRNSSTCDRRFWNRLALTLPLVAAEMAGCSVRCNSASAASACPGLQLLLATPVVLWCGWPLLARGWRSIVHRSPNMFTLIGSASPSPTDSVRWRRWCRSWCRPSSATVSIRRCISNRRR